MKRLQPARVSVIICGLLPTHLTPQTPKGWKQVGGGAPAAGVHAGTTGGDWGGRGRVAADDS